MQCSHEKMIERQQPTSRTHIQHNLNEWWIHVMMCAWHSLTVALPPLHSYAKLIHFDFVERFHHASFFCILFFIYWILQSYMIFGTFLHIFSYAYTILTRTRLLFVVHKVSEVLFSMHNIQSFISLRHLFKRYEIHFSTNLLHSAAYFGHECELHATNEKKTLEAKGIKNVSKNKLHSMLAGMF